jgi:hypothetical protein
MCDGPFNTMAKGTMTNPILNLGGQWLAGPTPEKQTRGAKLCVGAIPLVGQLADVASSARVPGVRLF